MAQQRKKTAAPSKRPAGPLMQNIADPAPFYALGAAQFSDAIAVTKVISVVLPMRHLRDRSILHEMVLKKLLHRPFEPSADDLAQHSEMGPVAASSAPAGASSSPSASADVYVIVHIKAVEVHADTARQVNPQGDVQVNVMTTLVAARVRHGLVAGVAETSAFATCMQVRIPTVAVSAAVASSDSHPSTTDGLTLESDSVEDAAQAATAPSSVSGAVPLACQLRITARCLEDEPVVPGQSVLLVSEPAAMRCLAIRPPREAPGPFFFAEDTTTTAVAAGGHAKQHRASRKCEAEGRRVVVIACDIPESAAGALGRDAKRPRS